MPADRPIRPQLPIPSSSRVVEDGDRIPDAAIMLPRFRVLGCVPCFSEMNTRRRRWREPWRRCRPARDCQGDHLPDAAFVVPSLWPSVSFLANMPSIRSVTRKPPTMLNRAEGDGESSRSRTQPVAGVAEDDQAPT